MTSSKKNPSAALKRRNLPSLRRMILSVCVTLVCIGISSNQASGQSAGGHVVVSIEPVLSNTAAPVRQVANGLIDLSKLPAEILNCDVCRQRLGLPALKSQVVSTTDIVLPSHPRSAPFTEIVLTIPTLDGSLESMRGVRMLGSPGVITPAASAQMASCGLAVEEFQPPQAESDSIRLNGIPLDVRQQFLQNLDLPFGAKIMSAQVYAPKKPAANSNGVSEDKPSPELRSSVAGVGQDTVQATEKLEATESNETRSLGAPGIVSPFEPIELLAPKLLDPVKEDLADLKRSNQALQERLKEIAETRAAAQSEKERAMTNELQRLAEERDKLAKRISELDEQQKRAQDETDRRMAQADAVNIEVLSLLEKRTAEVTQLQVQLKAQQEKQKVHTTAEAKKPDEKKKPPKKRKGVGKKAPKPSIET